MFETFDSERKRRRDRQRRVSAAAVAGLPSTDLDSDDDTDESDKAEEETLAPSLRDERASKPMLPTSTPPGSDSGESFPSSHEQHPEQYRRRRRKRPSEVQVGVVPMLTRAKDNNAMQVTPNEGRVEDMIAKTEYSHLHYSRARQSQDEKIMQERKVDEQWRKQERREQQHQRQKLQQRSSDADLAHLHALAVARQYGSQAVASQSVGRVAWTPVARPRQQRLSASPMETIQSTTPLAQTSRTAVAEEEEGGASTSGNDSRSGDKEKEHPPLTLSPSSSATSLQQRISRSNSGAFANAVNPADVPTLRRGPTPKEILGPNSVELPASDRGKDLYGTILWSRTGQDMAPIGIMTPNNRGQIEGDPAPSFNTLGQHVSPSSISERICIQKFGISYHEIISKLVMEQGVLSEAESRMVLLLLSEPSDQTKLPETQMRMLRAVVEIETRGISRATIHAFRRELAAVAVEVAQQTEMVRALAENDVLLARATDGAPKDKQTDTSALLNHPGAISPQGKITLESALEEAFQDLLAASDANSASSLSQQRHQQHPESPVAMFTGGTASASLASGLNALVLKEQESLLFPVTEELTGEHSSAGNTAHHQEKSESNTPLRALSQRTVLPNLKDDVDEEESDDGYSSVYDKMTRLQKSAPSHTIAASPSHSSFSVASGMSSMTSHWDKQDTTKRMMRVPVIDRVMSKIAKRISEIPRHKLLGRKQVILLGSGAYNPIHKMHLRMLYIARRYLEERTEFEVLGGLVSPAHATDVRSRFRQKPKEIIPPKHRLAMARAAVGDSTWLTVDPWEITRKRIMDYMSVMEHVQALFELCFPELPVKLIYLCNPDIMMKLSPDEMRERGYGCLCVCRPQETDRLLNHMGSRWKNVAFVVEDAAILSRELESTTSTRVRELAMEVEKEIEASRLPHFLRSEKNSTKKPGPTKLEELQAMVGAQVAKHIIKNKIGAKMSGKERWTPKDKEFELFSGLEKSDQGYEKEARRKPQRLVEKEELLANSRTISHKHEFEVL